MSVAAVSSRAEARHRSFIAFDFGIRRVGVATGNTLTDSAQPLCTLAAAANPPFEAIARLIAEWRPDALVVGVPFHPDGAAHANTRRARRFAAALRSQFGLPVHQVDERYTTTEAKALQATDLDAAAAAIILEQFLRSPGGGAGPRHADEAASGPQGPVSS